MSGDEVRRKRIQSIGLVAIFCVLVAPLVLKALVESDSSWVWAGVTFQILAVVAIVVFLVRVVQGRRRMP
jgi:hypothetical protein